MAQEGPNIHFRFMNYGNWMLQKMNVLREHGHFCDVTVHVNKTAFQGHKVVLAASSSFLRDQFLLKDSKEASVSLGQRPEVALDLLQSCYTGVLEFPLKDLISYLMAASYLQMGHVVEKCQQAASQYLEPNFSVSGISLAQEKLPFCDPEPHSPREGASREVEESSARKDTGSKANQVPHISLAPSKLDLKAESSEGQDDECAVVSQEPPQVYSQVDSGHCLAEWVNAEDLVILNSELEFQGLQPPSAFSAQDGSSSRAEESRAAPQEELFKGPYQCRVCSRVFRLLEKYVVHMRGHKVCLCLRCGKTFSQKVNLKRHVRSHMGFKPYRCHLCQKVFSQKVSLQDHMNLHSGARPHHCGYCKMQFTHKPALRRHLREFHGKTGLDTFNDEIEEIVL